MTDTDLIANPAHDAATAAPRRRGGLTGMVLADLRALAAEIGVGDTAGMRKGDLIVAIKQRQSGSGAEAAKATAPATAAVQDRAPRKRTAAVREEADASSSAAPQATALLAPAEAAAPAAAPPAPVSAEVVTAGSAESKNTQTDGRRPRQRRGASRAAGAVETGGGQSREAAESPKSPEANTNGASSGGTSERDAVSEPVIQPEKSTKADGGGQQREQGDRQQGGRGNSRQAGGSNQAGGNQTGGSNQAGGTGPQGQRNDRGGNDEEGDGRGRRGRRFRERRRGRDRGGELSQGGQNDRDIEVRDDDVLQPVAGILDVLDNYAFVRTSGYLAGPNDVYVSMSLVRKNGLRRGDAITGAVRIAREGEQSGPRAKFNPLVRIDTINGGDAEAARNRPEFNKLTPLYPNQRLRLETTPQAITTRIIDLVMPIGKGQRALIVSPPKAGKTSVLQAIANAIAVNNPECHLMVVLVDERPEEVTDMQRSVKGEVIASTFDRPPGDHTAVAELAIERAKRLVESGMDVVVLLDSITRLGRAYNNSSPASGRILSGGVDSTALYPPKRFLGAARNIEFGGSLTIIATAMVETGSTGDTVIFEEFKGTGNAELKLDRKIAERRVFPAVDVNPSGTRKDELLMNPDEYQVALKLRRVLSGLDSHQAIDLLTDRLRKSGSNAEFLMQVAKTAPSSPSDQRES
ncbi:MAG: transcription termination factor Rho [Mycobacteriaceae bacterium]